MSPLVSFIRAPPFRPTCLSSLFRKHPPALPMRSPGPSPIPVPVPAQRTISSSVQEGRSDLLLRSPRARLSLIARHLDHRPFVEINTPFSTERLAGPHDDLLYTPLIRELPDTLRKEALAWPTTGAGSEPTTTTVVDETATTIVDETTTTPTTPADPTTTPADETTAASVLSEPTTIPSASKQTTSPAAQQRRSHSTMSAQPEHPTLLIPGPIEFDDAVLKSMGHFSESHVGQGFVNTFGEALTMLRSLFQTTAPGSQPFVISGSGTLGWDLVAANLVERGDDVLVLHTGYFADSFADCFATYGVRATQLKAAIGSRPSLDEVRAALAATKYKMVTITHVDTSTGVLSDVPALAALVHEVSPDTLIVVDGVCSVGSENVEFDAWGLDVVLTASQKGIGVPAGLSILMASERAIAAFQARTSPPASYFASFKNWLPIMQNYEAKKASYFATPSPQLIHALHTSLTQILARPLSARFAAQHAASQRVKRRLEALGLAQLAADPACQANGMTAFWLPDGITPAAVMPKLVQRGVVLAGGLHREIAARYMRFGHMGVSAVDPARSGDLDKAFTAVEEVLGELGWKGKGKGE